MKHLKGLIMAVNIWKSCMRRNEYRIDPRSYELILDKWPEKNSGPYGIWTQDLYHTGAALYQLR